MRQADGEWGAVEAVAIEARTQVMYNLTVATAHTFFVSQKQWLVHNTCAKPVAVIGRIPDTAVAKEWPGHEVLDIPDWKIEKNDAWVQSVIERRMDVYIASPEVPENL